MRVHYLSASTIPSRTANAIHVMKMCAAFVRSGHDVVLHARLPKSGPASREEVASEYGVSEEFEIRYHPWSAVRGFGGMSYGWSVRRDIVRTDSRPDVLYGRDLYSLAACATLSIPCRYEVHALPVHVGRRVLEKWLFRRSGFRRLVSISRALGEAYTRELLPEDASAPIVAHDGADDPGDALVGSRQDIDVGYVGHLHPGKGVELIVEIARAMPDVGFDVFGGTETAVREWKSRVDLPNLRFHGWIRPTDVPDTLARCRIVLAPYGSRVATFGGRGDIAAWMSPLKLFESMALGRAIVVSDLPVLREVMEDGRNCLMCPPEDVEDWCHAIRRLLGDARLREVIGRQAREDFLDRYTWTERARLVLA